MLGTHVIDAVAIPLVQDWLGDVRISTNIRTINKPISKISSRGFLEGKRQWGHFLEPAEDDSSSSKDVSQASFLPISEVDKASTTTTTGLTGIMILLNLKTMSTTTAMKSVIDHEALYIRSSSMPSFTGMQMR